MKSRLLDRRQFLKNYSGSIALASTLPYLFRKSAYGAVDSPKKTGLFYDARCKDFKSLDGAGAEDPARLDAIINNFKGTGLINELAVVSGFGGELLPHLKKLHTEEHINGQAFGISNLGNENGSLAAEIALAGVLGTVQAVHDGIIRNGFCAIRPPGHHVTNDGVFGFCYYANVALAARYAQDVCQMEKVLIIDWDYHHGNGTQDFFYEDPTVLFISTHSRFGWPGSGPPSEQGKGAGMGYTINAYLDDDPTETGLLKVFNEQLLPKVEAFKPDIVMISAGFDSRIDDLLGRFEITDEGFHKATRFAMDIADAHCDGRLVSLLEGGYNLDGLAKAANSHTATLAGKDWKNFITSIPRHSTASHIPKRFHVMGNTLICPDVEATQCSGGAVYSLKGGLICKIDLQKRRHFNLKTLQLPAGKYLMRINAGGKHLQNLQFILR